MSHAKLILAVAAFLTTNLAANVEGGPPSLRELCRKEVGGYVVSLFDLRKRSEEFVIHLTESLKQTQQRKREAAALYAKRQKEAEAAPYDLQKQRDAEAAKSMVAQIEDQIAENLDLTVKAKSDYKGANAEIETVKPKIEKIFRIEMLKENDKPFPLILVYREQCPRFQEGCRLSKESAHDLLELATLEKFDAKSCKLYAAQSGVGR